MSTNEHQRPLVTTEIVVGMKLRSKSGWIGTVVGLKWLPQGYRPRRGPCDVDVERAVWIDWGNNILADELEGRERGLKFAYVYSLDTVRRLEVVKE